MKGFYKMNKEYEIREKNAKSFGSLISKEMKEFNAMVANKSGQSDKNVRVNVIFNSDGFRSIDFEKNIDLLSAGCSFTFGVGLPKDVTWSNMLAKEHGFSHNSIGIPGGSCMDIVFNIFKYFEKYGHPKMLLAFFPDFGRVYTYMDGNILNTSKMFGRRNGGGRLEDVENKSFINDRVLDRVDEKPSKFVSLPTNLGEIMSLEFAYMLNAMYIKMLEAYCNSHKIPFIWFKWNLDHFDQYGGIDSFSNRYVIDIKKDLPKFENGDYVDLSNHKCHLNDKEVCSDQSIWYMAKDNNHFGVHWQIHVKELFERALKEKDLI
jgi:hypothetical protein